MKLTRAIEILSLAAHGHALTTGPEFYSAVKLGMEALKYVQADRRYGILLHGETNETEEERPPQG